MALNYENAPDCVLSVGTINGPDIADSNTTDDSQKGDNLTAGTGVVYDDEDNHSYTRFDLQGVGTIDCAFLHDGSSSTTGTLWAYRDSGDTQSSIELRITSPFTVLSISLTVNGSEVLSEAIDNIDSDYFLVTWSGEPNPDTTGASNAILSEIQIFNLSSGNEEFETYTVAHEVPASDTAGRFTVGGRDSSGTNAYDSDVTHVRVCKAFHSSTETYETYLTSSSAPTLYGVERLQVPVLDRGDVSHLDDGEYAGPAYSMAAQAVRQLDLALAGPLVNEQMRDSGRSTEYNTSLDAYRKASHNPIVPSSGQEQQWLQLLYYRPVPPWATHAHVRLFVQNYDSASMGTPSTTITVFSATQPTDDLRMPNSPQQIEAYYTHEEVTTDHGVGNTGEWAEFTNVLKLARDNANFTWLSVGVTPTHDARIKAVIITPLIVEDDDGVPFDVTI